MAAANKRDACGSSLSVWNVDMDLEHHHCSAFIRHKASKMDIHPGIYVLRDVIFPKNEDTSYFGYLRQLVKDFNTKELTKELELFILSRIISKANDEKDYLGHIVLLGCNKRHIQNCVFRSLEKLLHSVDIQYCDPVHFCHCLMEATHLLDKHCADKNWEQRKGRLCFGPFAEALQIKEHRKSIQTGFHKFSNLEQWASLYGVLNLVYRQPRGNHLQLFDLGKELLKVLSQKKQKKNVIMKLLMATKMIKGIIKESNELDWKNLLELMASNKGNKQADRQYIVLEIKDLIFHSDGSIVTTVMKILLENGVTPWKIQQTVLSHIKEVMSPVELNIDSERMQYCSDQLPAWQIFSGQLGSFPVNVNVLLPSNYCLSQGMFYNYSQNVSNREKLILNKNNLKILSHLCNNENSKHILQLFAYQSEAMPMFFITQKSCPGDYLNNHLQKRRCHKNWFSMKSLTKIALGCVEAVKFLHDRHVIHRNLTTFSFSLMSDMSVLLHEFDLAIRDWANHTKEDTEYILECNDIPLRWSPSESILLKKFSKASDRYMVGQVLYEIFSHGCQPFTELYKMDLETALRKIVLQNLKPMPWPCIPKVVNKVIFELSQTNPKVRPNLESVIEKLKVLGESLLKDQHLVHDELNGDIFPEIDETLPEYPQTILPEFVRQMRDQCADRKIIYTNLRKSAYLVSPLEIKITDADLAAPDDPTTKIIHEEGCMEVREPISQQFEVDSLGQLFYSTSPLRSALRIRKWPPLLRNIGGKRIMVSRCNRGESLRQISISKGYGHPRSPNAMLGYLRIIRALAKFVEGLHSNQCLLRDFSCTSLFYDKYNDQVFSIKLGRIVQISKGILDDSILDDSFTSTRRRTWLPLESLKVGQFSMESDVFSTGMTIYEFFRGLNLDGHQDPRMCVPFYNFSPEQHMECLYADEFPEHNIDYCPVDLHDVLKKCWSRERSQRSSCKELLHVVQNLLAKLEQCDNLPQEVSESSTDMPCSTSSDEENFNPSKSQKQQHGKPKSATRRKCRRNSRMSYVKYTAGNECQQENPYATIIRFDDMTGPEIKSSNSHHTEISTYYNDLSSKNTSPCPPEAGKTDVISNESDSEEETLSDTSGGYLTVVYVDDQPLTETEIKQTLRSADLSNHNSPIDLEKETDYSSVSSANPCSSVSSCVNPTTDDEMSDIEKAATTRK